jgi:hypothetical protein
MFIKRSVLRDMGHDGGIGWGVLGLGTAYLYQCSFTKCLEQLTANNTYNYLENLLLTSPS